MEEEGRSLAETPTWSVATVTTLMVATCFLIERSLTPRQVAAEDEAEGHARRTREDPRRTDVARCDITAAEPDSQVDIGDLRTSTPFTSKFYMCTEKDFDDLDQHGEHTANNTHIARILVGGQSMHVCDEGHEPFVSYEGLEQLHRFLFILGFTHVLYSFVTVVLSMIKLRKWETQACTLSREQLQPRRKVMRRQSTFVFHHASHPWSKSKILLWMYHKLPHSYDFHKYMVRSMEDDYNGSVGISWPLWVYAIICIFVNVHGLNIYFWLSFAPVILVLLVGTELQHVIAQLALEVVEATATNVGTQLKLRDDLFWFGKPRVLWWLIQFISFQNAFEMATFLWSLWELSANSCFMKNQYMVVIRLASGLLVQVWCSYSTLPLNVIISQMGSKFKKSLVSESVRDSLHSWCKRIKERRHNPLFMRNGTLTSRSVCSLDTTIYETDHETNTVCTLSRTVSASSLDEALTAITVDDEEEISHIEEDTRHT
ncbi:hypothetical protein ZWY2020_013981 [Hordeum vulgare]|nr:hypothetical protein ZWY2020_013981 [Hordeum vulgare]